MLEIPGIGSEQVRLYGRKFLPLIQNAKRGYEAMMESENRPQDPNHQNVIDISSDGGDDYEFEDALDSFEDNDSQGERSQYFQHDEEVAAFNARCKLRRSLSSRNRYNNHSFSESDAAASTFPSAVNLQ